MPLTLSAIIYVDDKPEDRKFFRDTIAVGLSNTVDYLSSGEELIDRLEDNRRLNLPQPRIILIDLVLPGMSGYELVQRLRQSHKYMDVSSLIILSGAWNDESKATAKAAGADWYLGKPVTIFGFLDALRHCTGRYKFGIFEEDDASTQVQTYASTHR